MLSAAADAAQQAWQTRTPDMTASFRNFREMPRPWPDTPWAGVLRAKQYEIRHGTFFNTGPRPTEWYSSIDNAMSMATEPEDGDRWDDWATVAQMDFWNITQFKYALLQGVKCQKSMDNQGALWQLYTKWAYPNEKWAIYPKCHTPSFLIDFLCQA